MRWAGLLGATVVTVVTIQPDGKQVALRSLALDHV